MNKFSYSASSPETIRGEHSLVYSKKTHTFKTQAIVLLAKGLRAILFGKAS